MKKLAIVLAMTASGCSIFERVDDPVDESVDAADEAGDATSDTLIDAREAGRDGGADLGAESGDAFDAGDAVDTRDAGDAHDAADGRGDALDSSTGDTSLGADTADTAVPVDSTIADSGTTVDTATPDTTIDDSATAIDTAIDDSGVDSTIDSGVVDTFDAAECTPGAVDAPIACGTHCGTQTRTCGADGRWGAYGACGGEGPCAPGEVTTVAGACASVGDVQQETCSASCSWGAPVCVTPSGWRTMSAGPLAGRAAHSAVWTGSQMLIWGGRNTAGTALYGDGARYDLATDTWSPMAPPPTGFAARSNHGTAWTGSKMVVWGGSGSTGSLADGAIYDPSKDSWKLMRASPLTARFPNAAYATTTGDVLLWGNASIDGTVGDGAAYTPVTDAWTAMPSFPLAARNAPVFQWTGTQLMVWGGGTPTTTLSDGARYNPVSGSWTKLDSPPLGFMSRVFPGQCTVNGGLIFVGGISPAGPTYLADGLYFDAAGAVQVVAPIPSSVLSIPARDLMQAWCDGADRCWFWSGGQLDMFTGTSASVLPGGASYSLSSKTWSSMTLIGEPVARAYGSAVWTGKSAIVWGGSNPTGEFADGAVFTP